MNNRNLKLYIPGIAALVVLALLIGGYVFMLNQVDGYIMRMSLALGDTETLTARDTQARSTEVFLSETAPLREVLAGVVIANNDEVSVIEILEDIANNEGVELSISSVSVAQPGWSYHERIDAQFTILGSFDDVLTYASTIEALPFAARLEAGRLEASNDGDWFGAFTATFIKETL